MTLDRVMRLHDLADHFWYLAERAEAEGRTRDVVEGLQHKATIAKIAAGIEERRSVQG